ncbi:hypothetical protein BC938DRAFT_483915 [Jimgerdemannia flammicorona]|uniref:Uncharacterized protein n=1 Tax=Jimgerdemannia flammicorona TaxID=994334 RepID=A0A433QAY8_9FUNG|nr:hypothetical protein BC938DRAFT_483915 [Jimgerdemannia flammicorona]
MDTPQSRTAVPFEETLGQLVCIACISAMSALFGIKIAGNRLKDLNYARILVLLLYVTSWAFTNMAAVLISTNTGNFVSCNVSILACVTFYAGSNIVMYLWYVSRSNHENINNSDSLDCNVGEDEPHGESLIQIPFVIANTIHWHIYLNDSISNWSPQSRCNLSHWVATGS